MNTSHQETVPPHKALENARAILFAQLCREWRPHYRVTDNDLENGVCLAAYVLVTFNGGERHD